MKRIVLAVAVLPLLCSAEGYPTPTFQAQYWLMGSQPKVQNLPWLWFQVDVNNAVDSFFGYNAGKGASTAAVLSHCFGTNTCGALGPGMTGVENTAFGWNSQAYISTGGFNTSFGVNTMGAETTGQANAVFGEDAMRDTKGVNNSVAIGSGAMRNNSGSNNVAVGWQALGVGLGTTSLGTASNNVAVGYSALGGAAVRTASNNVAVGDNAMNSPVLTAASNNVAIGTGALSSVATGQFNTAIGYRAGAAVQATGNGNILIGQGTDTPAAGTSNYLEIGGKTGTHALAGSMAAWTTGNLSGCGTSPAIANGTSDIRGTITTGAKATSCTLTFTTAKTSAPTCVISARSGHPPAYTTSAEALTLSAADAGATYDYICFGS